MKIFIASLVLICSSLPAFALTKEQMLKAEFELNKANPNAMAVDQLGSQTIQRKKQVLKATYSFAVQGGVFGSAISLLDSVTGKAATLPKGAIVSDCLLDFKTTTTSLGSATISISTGQGAADLKSALAVASGTGLVTCIPIGSAATAIKMTANQSPTITINTASLTAGVLNVLIEYWMSDI